MDVKRWGLIAFGTGIESAWSLAWAEIERSSKDLVK